MTPFGSKSSLLIVRVVRGGSQLGLALDIHLKLEGVQVVEEVGLVARSFQFFTRFAAVFTEEVGDFASFILDATIQRVSSLSFFAFISTFAYKKFNDFFAIFSDRIMQWSLSKHTLYIHIRPSS